MINANRTNHVVMSLFGLILGSLIFGCATKNSTLGTSEDAGIRLSLGYEALAGPMRINRGDFGAPDLESIKSASPTMIGGSYLQAAVSLDPQFGDWIALHGIPDAIAPVPGRVGQFTVFYLNPPRSYSVEKGAIVSSLSDVPHSVRRITFGEKTMAPPWPATIPLASAAGFGVPPIPPPPPSQFDWVSYSDDATKVRSLLTRVDGRQAIRANETLERLKAVEQTQGIAWSVEVFNYRYEPLAFAVPDGSIFISDKLMEETTDPELAAAIAHLMAHIRYGHYTLVPVQVVKQSVAPAQTTAESQESIEAGKKKQHKAGAVALTALANTLIVAWDVAAVFGGLAGGVGLKGAEATVPVISTEQMERALAGEPKSSPGSLKQANLERIKAAWPSRNAPAQRDIEANYLAARYLVGIDVPPDALFNMLMRLPLHPPFPPLESQIHTTKTAFAAMYDTDNNGAFDFGKMLDAGLIATSAWHNGNAR